MELPLDTIILTDCLGEKGMPSLPDKSIDLTVTSPPYDNLRTYNGTLEWNENIWKAIIRELFRVTKDGGVVVWVVGDATINGSETGTSFRQALYFMEVGFNLHDTMIYQKENPIPVMGDNRYNQCFEYVFILSKHEPKNANIIQIKTKTAGKKYRVKRNNNTSNGGGAISTKDKCYVTKETKAKENIWIFSTISSNEYCGHPAVFPYQLAHDHIISWSNVDDVVLDPMAGSCTTALAAWRTQRHFICMEKDPKYWADSMKRIEPYLKQQRLM